MAAEATSLAKLLNEISSELLPPGRWPQTLTEMVDAAVHELSQVLPSDQALNYARIAILAAARQIGGERIYLPRGDAVAIALRDAIIWHEHNRGDGVTALGTRHDLSRTQVYDVLQRQRALRVAR